MYVWIYFNISTCVYMYVFIYTHVSMFVRSPYRGAHAHWYVCARSAVGWTRERGYGYVYGHTTQQKRTYGERTYESGVHT